MSVLESMRSGSDSTFMQVVLALVVVSFVFWYAVPQGEMSRVVAEVNGTKIMDTSYNRAFRNALAQSEQRYGRVLSNEERAQIGEQVRQQLIEDEVVLQESEALGIEVSDTEIRTGHGRDALLPQRRRQVRQGHPRPSAQAAADDPGRLRGPAPQGHGPREAAAAGLHRRRRLRPGDPEVLDRGQHQGRHQVRQGAGPRLPGRGRGHAGTESTST